MAKRIVIMAGGTGGHIFPALAVAQYLQQEGWQVSWMGTKNGMESKIVPDNGIVIEWLPVSGVRGKGLLAKLSAPLMIIKSCFAAAKILKQRQPHVVLGMGGFVSGPGGIMCKLLGIPLVIHEQNRIPGTANRLLAKAASVVCEAFPGSFKAKYHAQCTGNPLRKAFTENISNVANQSHEKQHLLVVGGSLGAQVLNETVPAAIAELDNIIVKHQTGAALYESVSNQYQHYGIEAEVFAFIDDMRSAYQWADFVICRAGAMTVSELAASALPAILIPFPFAIDDHQTANAKFLADAHAAFIIQQADLEQQTLIKQIKRLQDNLQQMSQAAACCAKPNATREVAEFCIREAKS